MRQYSSLRVLITPALVGTLILSLLSQSNAQTDDGFGDSAADPVKLFERGQNAHARGEMEKALAYYEQALKVRPDFPEAEFQKGGALVSLGRFPEAESSFRRAINLKKKWSLPYSALGSLLIRRSRDVEAEPILREALSLDPSDGVALRLLADLKLRAGANKEALELARRATADKEAPPTSWLVLATAERANGNTAGAKKILDQVLNEDATNLAALVERADLFAEESNWDAAIADLKSADKLKRADKVILSRLAYVYQQAGRQQEANEVATAAGLRVEVPAGNEKTGVVGTPEEIEAANSIDPAVARQAVEKLLEKNPRSALLLAKLGGLYRTENPEKSLDLYRRASELRPDSAEYATGYAAALVQARRFLDAALILQKVLETNPESYSAHANLATALYELKKYGAAIPHYQWLLSAKPEIAIAHYFIATAHDNLGEYEQALVSYERFLADADHRTNQLEIEKVRLRLPTLQRQIKLGEGVKKKPQDR